MLTKEEIIDFLKQIEDMEKRMADFYRKLEMDLTSPKFKSVFRQLAEEEDSHSDHLERLMAIFGAVD